MRLIPRFTTGRNLIAISAFAVFIPTAILSTLQYRSLQQLRDKTRLVAQDQVRQGLELLQVRLEGRVAAIAVESLSQINGADFGATNLGATGVKFQAIAKKYRSSDTYSSCRNAPVRANRTPSFQPTQARNGSNVHVLLNQ